ncbi:MAG: hypothetical protein Q9220_001262 [cf. Caloplaca sp. 1 TL-2023]
MRSSFAIVASILALAYPTATFAQRGGRGGGPGRGRPANTAVVVAPTTAIIVPTSSVVVNNLALTNAVEDQVVNTQGNGVATTTSPPTSESTGGGGGGNNGGGCVAVSGNMNVQVSGDNVAFRFDPPVAGNPTTGMTGDCPVWTFPPGWGGRVNVGGGDGAPFGSTLYEGNVNGSKAAMDVSFVEGFSVPMMCTDNGNGKMSGCAIDLWKGTAPCPTGGSEGGVCKNPQGPGGTRDSAKKACWACSPPDPFFGPCSAAAFTFPTDDEANDGEASLDISCVIGASNVRTNDKREGTTATTGQAEAGRCEVCTDGTKRSLERVLFGRNQESPLARSPSTLPRTHRKSSIDLDRRSHRHGMAAHDGKVR